MRRSRRKNSSDNDSTFIRINKALPKKKLGVLDKWSLIGKWSLTRGGRKWRFDCTSSNENLQLKFKKFKNCNSQMRNEDSRSSRKRPRRKFKKVVVTRAGRLLE